MSSLGPSSAGRIPGVPDTRHVTPSGDRRQRRHDQPAEHKREEDTVETHEPGPEETAAHAAPPPVREPTTHVDLQG